MKYITYIVYIFLIPIIFFTLLIFLYSKIQKLFKLQSIKKRIKLSLFSEQEKNLKPKKYTKPEDALYQKNKHKEENAAAVEIQNLEQDEIYQNVVYANKEQSYSGKSKNDDVRIVGVEKPKGFWTRLIMSQKMRYILARIQAQDIRNGGFWTNLLKAQSMSQGKDKSRGGGPGID